MSFKDIKTKTQSERGFTIVELLIVIVVIGILAAITIVSFNGVTARANATSAKAAASSALKKAEAYNAEKAVYPTTPAQLTGAASTDTFQLTGVAFDGTGATASTTAPVKSSVLQFFSCASATGFQVKYWDYAASPAAWVIQTTGSCTSPTYVPAATAPTA